MTGRNDGRGVAAVLLIRTISYSIPSPPAPAYGKEISAQFIRTLASLEWNYDRHFAPPPPPI